MKRRLTKPGLIIPVLLIQILVTHPGYTKESSPTHHSNLNNFSYPYHNCKNKPTKPIKPARLSSFQDIDAYNIAIAEYNIQVAIYNKTIKIYKSCVNQYIKNGNNDINAIRTKLNKALKEARSNK